MCPYHMEGPSTWCNISGCNQDDYQKQNYCRSSSNNWKRCPNYENANLETKVSKALRPNSDL